MLLNYYCIRCKTNVELVFYRNPYSKDLIHSDCKNCRFPMNTCDLINKVKSHFGNDLTVVETTLEGCKTCKEKYKCLMCQ